ncbi:hypothetical protein Q7P35_004440 [Cladosporium inversicolor]
MLSSSSPSLFTSLPARPPTPPKDVQEHVQNALDFLENGHEEAEQDASEISKRQLSTDTPPVSSPVSSIGAPPGSNAAKKVGFSPFPPTFHEIPKAGISSSPRDRLLRSTPRPRNTKPVKSILKLSSFAPPPTPDEQEQRLGYFSPEDPASFGKMLQSVLKELASSSKSSRLDAYLALQGALIAYDGIPDRHAMAANMPQFQQFLSRDLMWRDSSGLIDTQIATQALKLACTMVFDTQLSKAMDDEFRVFLIDRSITVMEQPDMPKALVKTHLYLVAQQKFHQSIITSNRAERMISALRTIEERCSSNSLIATRLVIYQRLLDQAPSVMSARLKDWLEHVFHGMLSSINDTRTRAIEVGNHAGLLLGNNPTASKALHDLFETEVEEGQCYCDYLTLRLTSMIGDKERQSGVLVPQIWSAVVLFFRTKRRPLEKWPRLRTWLQVLQKCLNSSDLAIKNQANLAWKKLVFAVMPDATTGAPMLSMLKVPIKAGFEKRNNDRTGKQARQFALDGYHNLLHYSMRPSSSHADLDITWDAYVAPILSEMIEASHKGRINACNILYGLLSSNAGVWNEYAALDATPIKSHDLPRLDPRWVRTRLTKVLALVEPIVSAGLWVTEEESLMTAKLWQSTLQSIAEAGAQEVRTSNELREAIALVMNMFQRLWKSLCAADAPGAASASTNFQEIMRTTCHYIGPSLLAEDILARTPEGDAEAAPTPSHRPSKHQHVLYSPLIFTLTMMCSQMHPGESQKWRSMAADVVELACKSKATSAARLQLLNRTAQAVRTNCTSVDAEEPVAILRSLFAERATEALQHSKTESIPTGTLGQKLRDALSIVVCGLPMMHSHPEGAMTGSQLVEEIIAVARCKAGDAGVILAVIEPLCKTLLDRDALIDCHTRIAIATILLRSGGWPQNRQSMEQGRKTLWGIGSGPHRAGTFDPYEHMYSLTKEASRDAYTSMESDTLSNDHCHDFLNSLTSFVRNCPISLLVNTLRHVQEALVVWLEDDKRRALSGIHSPVAQSVVELWNQVLGQLAELPRKDGSLLTLLQPLMVAGFVSPKLAVVNRTITFWNECFGQLDSLRYPSKLEKVLRAASNYVELDLPDFPENAADEEPIHLPAFSGPQDEDSQLDPKSSSSSRWKGLPRGTASPAKRTPASIDVSSRLATIETGGTFSASKSNSKSTTAKARLRHDDSQILFAPIDSSPLPIEDESQILTDHQKEVRARQVEGAQMFPDISSTPVRKSTPRSRRNAPGILDFSTNIEVPTADDEVVSTPLDVPEAHGETSGYMGSSPTPNSSAKPRHKTMQIETAHANMDEEPSSSPPRSPDQNKTERPVNEDHQDDGVVADSAPPFTRLAKRLSLAREQRQVQQNSDLPSDTALPTEQLQLEANAAGIQTNGVDASHHTQTQVDATTIIDPTEMIAQSTAEDGDNDNNDDVSRVENSFVEQRENPDPIAEPSPSDSQYLSRSGRKRKRVNDAVDNSPKKQKHQSPFRRVFSGIFGRSQQEDDDIGDEIIVASSQVGDSPAAEKGLKVEEPKDTEESIASSQKPKRGRGRPRKSETPTPVPTPVAEIPLASSTRLKRRASALSETEGTPSEPTTSELKTTPAPKRQRRRAKAKKAVEEARKSQEDSGSRPPSRRATAVVIERPDSDVDISQTRVASDDDDASGGESQENIKETAATPSWDTPKSTPKSILGRLKDILGDCRNAIFGSQEERDFDDVLFELRREVHGAAARGRQT